MNTRLLLAVILALALLCGAAAFLFLGSAGPPPVAKENPCDVFPSLDGALAGWMRQQRDILPGLTCEHFEKVADTTPTVEPSALWQDAGGVLGSAPAHWRSPEKGRMLQPGPDSLALIDLAGGTRRTLLETAKGESWSDAGWMDGQSFVAAGVVRGPAPGMQAPTLTVFRLDANRVSVFRGPAAPIR